MERKGLISPKAARLLLPHRQFTRFPMDTDHLRPLSGMVGSLLERSWPDHTEKTSKSPSEDSF